MSTTMEVAVRTSAAEGPSPDVVIIPVSLLGEDLVMPLGLPDAVAGISVPSSIAADFAQR